jgi:hypothetical protein
MSEIVLQPNGKWIYFPILVMAVMVLTFHYYYYYYYYYLMYRETADNSVVEILYSVGIKIC